MDDWKQLKTNVASLEDDSRSLYNSLLSHGKSVVDILRLHKTEMDQDLLPVATNLKKSVSEVEDYIKSLQCQLSTSLVPNSLQMTASDLNFISSGLPTIDKQLGGGIPLGEITEVFGASGCGKSQFLFQLSLQSQLLGSTQSQCIFISTESFLETNRLNDMHKAFLNRGTNTTLDNVSYVYCHDLESQDHILFTQLPVKLENSSNRVRLVVIDSIAQHLRRENAISNSSYLREKIYAQESLTSKCKDFFDVKVLHEQHLKTVHKSAKYSDRASKYHYLYLLHRHLAWLARKYNLAIVVINQISDYASDPKDPEGLDDPLLLNYQVGVHSGWDMKSVFRAFSMNHLHSVFLNTDENVAIEQQLQQTLKKRSKVDSNVDSLDENYKLEESLLAKLHKSTNSETKFQVPTLGYSWGRRISNKILLTKSYRPNIKNRKDLNRVDCEEQLTYEQSRRSSDSQKPSDLGPVTGAKRKLENEVKIESIIEGWKVERFAIVVSSSRNTDSAPSEKVEFVIKREGIREVA